MIIKCHHCLHEWDYKGKSNKYVTCPVCHYKVNISKSLTDIDLNISYHNLINRLSKIENAISNLQNSLVLNTPAFHSVNVKSSSGLLIRCDKCRYSWYFKGLKHIARCPECNHRVVVQDNKVK